MVGIPGGKWAGAGANLGPGEPRLAAQPDHPRRGAHWCDVPVDRGRVNYTVVEQSWRAPRGVGMVLVGIDGPHPR